MNSKILIDCERLTSNIQILSDNFAEGMGIMAVVKSDAYGHGAVEVAHTVESLVEAFAVNDIQEAIELREHDIKAPILVFEPPSEHSVQHYLRLDLTATISSVEHFDLLLPGTSYHLNFDTGMRRLGFKCQQAAEISRRMKAYSQLQCTGLYTHFATADVPSSDRVMQQQRRFEEICHHFPSDLNIHIANTGGAAFYNFNQYDMIRLGIGMYGYPPGQTAISSLYPVLSWSSHLVAVNEIGKGESVSYGATWKAPADGYIGIIPVGYEDGLRRNLTGQLKMLIDSREYEVAGTITMNYCMIYLKDHKHQVGTPVQILDEFCDAAEWARKTGTIPYEILTGIGRNIPRIYLK